MDIDHAAIQEAARRRLGMNPSGAGIAGGMPASNQMRAGNPIAQQGQLSTTPPSPSPQNPPSGASEGGIKAVNQAMPGEATMIIKALIKQLDRLSGGNKIQNV